MNLPTVAGHIALASVTSLAESLRLDIGFRALEVHSHARTYGLRRSLARSLSRSFLLPNEVTHCRRARDKL